MEFKDLLVEHDYYCSENNYYSTEPGDTWEDFQSFFDEYSNADVDMNLIFRWDILKKEDSDGLYMQVFVMHQRKGIFAPHYIENVSESDFENIKALLRPHFDKLLSIWKPFQ